MTEWRVLKILEVGSVKAAIGKCQAAGRRDLANRVQRLSRARSTAGQPYVTLLSDLIGLVGGCASDIRGKGEASDDTFSRDGRSRSIGLSTGKRHRDARRGAACVRAPSHDRAAVDDSVHGLCDQVGDLQSLRGSVSEGEVSWLLNSVALEEIWGGNLRESYTPILYQNLWCRRPLEIGQPKGNLLSIASPFP